MIGSSHKARTPAAETTATSTNLPAFAAPETDVPQKEGALGSVGLGDGDGVEDFARRGDVLRPHDLAR